MCLVKIGNIIEGIISVLTLGWGKDIATYIANKLGYADCGCERRRVYLNALFGCKEKRIEL